jgi:hypothetical protein
MTVKEPKQIIFNIYKKYIKVQDNVVYARKLFVINVIIKFIFADGSAKVTAKLLAEYGELIDRYLKDEVDIRWKHGSIEVEELPRKRVKNNEV